MIDEALNKCADNNNYTIYTSMCKAQRILMRSYQGQVFLDRYWLGVSGNKGAS